MEHLDIEKVVLDNFSECKVIHKERKNMGMTYVYIIENSPPDNDDDAAADSDPDQQSSETAKTNKSD